MSKIRFVRRICGMRLLDKQQSIYPLHKKKRLNVFDVQVTVHRDKFL